MLKKIKKYSGFSFLEAIISVFILSIGIVAVMSLVTFSLRESLYAKDHQIAILLAEEGIELVRNVRDNNWVNPSATSTFVHNDGGQQDFPAGNQNNCLMDDASTRLICGGSSKLLRMESNGYYRHTPITLPATKFYRIIHIAYDTGSGATAKNATITSVVYWKNNPGSVINDTTCNASKSCAYARTDLRKWGE